jgi:hypothetical protein
MIDTDSPPVGYYLDSIRLGGSDAFEAPAGTETQKQPAMRISSGDQSLTLTYKHGGGIMRGMVASCGFGVVKLVPRDAARRHPSLIRSTTCDRNSKFDLLSVRPGEYYAFAILPGNDFARPDKLDAQLKQSTPITVADNQTITSEIHLIQR